MDVPTNLTKQQLIQMIASEQQNMLNQYLQFVTIMQNYQMYMAGTTELAKGVIEASKRIMDMINKNVPVTAIEIEQMKKGHKPQMKPFKNFQKQPQLQFDTPPLSNPTAEAIPFNQNVHNDGVHTELVQGNFDRIGAKNPDDM